MFMATGYVLTQFLLGILVPLCIRRRSLVTRIIRLDLGGALTAAKLTLLKFRSCPSKMQRATSSQVMQISEMDNNEKDFITGYCEDGEC